MANSLTKIAFSFSVAVLGLVLSRPAAAMDAGTAPAAGDDAVIATRLSHALGLVVPKITTPVHGAPVTSAYGWRRHPILKRMRFHGGIDFGARSGTPVHAAAAGTIVKVARTKDRGRYVLVRHANRLETGYSHLAKVMPGVKVGAAVTADQVIGTVGTSGRSTGPHLDFEAYVDSTRIDPAPLLMHAVVVAPTSPAESLQLVMTHTLSTPPDVRTAARAPAQLEALADAARDRPV